MHGGSVTNRDLFGSLMYVASVLSCSDRAVARDDTRAGQPAPHVARLTIQHIAGHLDPKQFVRIHRSILVRKSAVRGLHPLFHGDYTVKLIDGTELTLSRTYREAFFDAMSR